MKAVTILALLLLASPVFGELTKEDLRTIVKEENAALEKRVKEYIDLKIETVNARIDAVEKSLGARIDALDKRMDNMWRLMMGLFGLVAATIAVPQIIIAYRARDQKGMESNQQEMQAQIDQLRAQIEAMQNTPS